MIRGDVKLVVEGHTSKARYKFRQLSREVTGASYDIPDNNSAIYAYLVNTPIKNVLIGGLCFQIASDDYQEKDFESEFFHQLPFMFVKKDYQGFGVGRQLIEKMISELTASNKDRPVHVQSALKAVGFFEKMGFKQIAEPFETAQPFHRGHLFQYLVNMEIIFPT